MGNGRVRKLHQSPMFLQVLDGIIDPINCLHAMSPTNVKSLPGYPLCLV